MGNLKKAITNAQPTPPERLLYSVREVAGLIGMCMQTVRSLLADGTIKFIAVSNRQFVPAEELKRFVTEGRSGRIRK